MVPDSKAMNEVGLFGDPYSVCQPTTWKWRYAVDRLKTFFRKWDQ